MTSDVTQSGVIGSDFAPAAIASLLIERKWTARPVVRVSFGLRCCPGRIAREEPSYSPHHGTHERGSDRGAGWCALREDSRYDSTRDGAGNRSLEHALFPGKPRLNRIERRKERFGDSDRDRVPTSEIGRTDHLGIRWSWKYQNAHE